MRFSEPRSSFGKARPKTRIALACAGLLITSTATGVSPPVPPVIEAEAPLATPYVDAHSPTRPPENHDPFWGERRVRNVSKPTLQTYRPAVPSACGTAVVVVPGGGFMFESVESEGSMVAEWLAGRGITAFLLKYRTNPSDPDTAKFEEGLKALFNAKQPPRVDKITDAPGAREGMEDGLEAIRWVRRHSKDYGLSPQRIGMIGFSAGGFVTLYAGTSTEAASRPDFIAPIYGGMPDREVPANPPPAFLVVAEDDPLLGTASGPIALAWRAKGGSAELHEYSSGGHGFGLLKKGKASDHWPEAFANWLAARGLAGDTCKQ
jgi:acetyl esterase/lipase